MKLILFITFFLFISCGKEPEPTCYQQPFKVFTNGLKMKKVELLSFFYSNKLVCEGKDCYLIDQRVVDIPIDTLIIERLVFTGNIYFYMRAWGPGYYAETEIDKMEICE